MAKRRKKQRNDDVGAALRTALADAARSDLRSEPDERVALRKAILALLVLHDDDDISAVEALRMYLLVQFPPLADAFSDHKHPLFGTEVMRARVGENFRLLMREDFAILAIAPTDGASS